MKDIVCYGCKKALVNRKGPLICTSCAKRAVEEESEFYKRAAEDTMQMRIQKIVAGAESRAALLDLGSSLVKVSPEYTSMQQRAAKPNEERQHALMAQQAASCRSKCLEDGCGMDGFGHYGGLCRDHYYECKHDAAVTIWARVKRRDLFTEVVGAVPFVGGSMIAMGAIYGIATERPGLTILCGFMYCLCVGSLWSEFGLSRDWKWKRRPKAAKKPMLSSKEPLSPPSV